MSDKIRIVFRINPAEHPDLGEILLAKPPNERNKFARGMLIRSFYGSGLPPQESAALNGSSAESSRPHSRPSAPPSPKKSLEALGEVGTFGFGLGKTP